MHILTRAACTAVLLCFAFAAEAFGATEYYDAYGRRHIVLDE